MRTSRWYVLSLSLICFFTQNLAFASWLQFILNPQEEVAKYLESKTHCDLPPGQDPLESSHCKTAADDPYDPKRLMGFGKFKDECMDTSEKRAPVILNGVKGTDDYIEIANYRDSGKFWIARIPKNQVERVVLQSANFGKPIPGVELNHVQLRFVLKPGVKLILFPQNKSDQSPPHEADGDLVFSTEYVAPKGESYSFLEGLGSHYGSVSRFVSTQDRIKTQIQGYQAVVEQEQLALTAFQRNKLLEVAIQQAAEARYTRQYNPITQNCYDPVFLALDEIAPNKNTAPHTAFRYTEPQLNDRGLRFTSLPLPTLNQEFQAAARRSD